jgi:hypothetical protein
MLFEKIVAYYSSTTKPSISVKFDGPYYASYLNMQIYYIKIGCRCVDLNLTDLCRTPCLGPHSRVTGRKPCNAVYFYDNRFHLYIS